MLIDTHCHLDDPSYAEDLQEVVLRQQQFGVERIIVPGINASSVATVTAICDRYPDYLYPAIGLHPEEVRENFQEELEKLYAALPSRKWVAIGEIGLDYHFDKTFRTEQVSAFRQQLHWAIQYDIPVIIHSRDATAECLDILGEVLQLSIEDNAMHRLRGVMHCFSGSREVAEQIVEMGLYIGIGGVITFKNSKLAENIKSIPLDRILLETDGPYLSPVPYRGKRNESMYIQYVAESLATVYQCTVSEVYEATTHNAKTLFFA